MLKKGLLAMLALGVVCCLTSCGTKEDADDVGDIGWEDTGANEVVPGEMVFIPAGEFIMGSNNKATEDANAFPEHKVKLSAFWIDKYEVTNMEFMEFSIENKYPGEGAKTGSDWRIFFTLGKENVPVVYITWNDANEYCKSQGKRLPTEQEWEYAARGPNGNAYPWGNEWENGRSNTNEAGREAVDIGYFDDVSYFGVHDMMGNVQEWTDSWYKSYPGGVADSKYGETLRVVRGLSPTYRGRAGNLWLRFAQPPASLFNFGCRCAKDATPEDIAANPR
ncbi:MAG: formylglycine-generating enzyme family protein [Acidobacteria bacterium]|nr:formylglycine-generating enzyme family protein [Acidobacteriota bacterium]